jgi:hypothetical protein
LSGKPIGHLSAILSKIIAILTKKPLPKAEVVVFFAWVRNESFVLSV